MARAYGSSAHLLMKRETGQAATGNYIRMAFNRCNLGDPAQGRMTRQNIPFGFAASSGTIWSTSQCSTILPSSVTRKISMPAQM
jgi:hypothetical protein